MHSYIITVKVRLKKQSCIDFALLGLDVKQYKLCVYLCRLIKKLEHTWKALVHDGVSVTKMSAFRAHSIHTGLLLSSI